MRYVKNDNNIFVFIPAANGGKFRFKKRASRLDFGATFSTRKCCFDDETYLEWQIGYDIPVNNVTKDRKETALTSRSFIGSNKKEKFPYELSEIFYTAMDIGLISNEKTQSLLTEIQNYQNFIDEKSITVEQQSHLVINNINFEETVIKLPTFFMTQTPDGTQIEVSVQKQQYASGVQPMVYFCIPLKAFKNWRNIYHKSSVVGDELVYIIDERNVENLVYMMKIFGMSSKRHNHDIVEILKTLLDIFSG